MDVEQIRRKITALENKNRVSIANSSIEAKCLKNEGSVLKASSGVITSNVVLKAPNIPEDLQQKVQKIDQFDQSLDELEEKVSKNTTDIANHTHADLSEAISKLEKALEGKLPSDGIEAVLQVIKEIQFIMTSTTSSWTLLHHVEEIQDEILAKFEEWTTKISKLDD